jgi:hypothetical protein
VSRNERNAACPCGSGRKSKRCCGSADVGIDPAALSRRDEAVGQRIQEWAYSHHRAEMRSALRELLADRSRVAVLGEADKQLITAWQLGDRELPGGGTPAQRYAELPGLDESERAIARRVASARLSLLRVRSANPGRSIELDDVTRGFARVRVVSHEVSTHVQTGNVLVGRLVTESPASLFGYVAVLDADFGAALIEDLVELVVRLGLDPDDEDALGAALRSSALEVTRLLISALHPKRSRTGSRRSEARAA